MNNKTFLLLVSALLFLGLSFSHSSLAQNSLNVSSPGSNSVWPVGSTQTITWSPNGSNNYSSQPPTVYINLNSTCTATSTPPCGNMPTVPYVIAQNAPDSGSFVWQVPSTLSDIYTGPMTISVLLSDSSAEGTSGQFYLSAGGNPYLSTTLLTSPSGGQQWPIGSTQSVNWPASSTISSVTIDLLPAAAGCNTSGLACLPASTTPQILAANLPNTGSFNWVINTDSNGRAILPGQYFISILNSSDNSPVASGNSLFNITAATGTATGTVPQLSAVDPISGVVGQSVRVLGTNFAATGNTVEFGTGTYLNNLPSENGSVIQFNVPNQTQPCSPNQTGACPEMSALITQGSYGISVSNQNGTSNTLPFEVVGSNSADMVAPTPASSTGISWPNGSLVMASGSPTVYLVMGGMLTPFTNPQIFLARGYQWSAVQVVQPWQFNAQNVAQTPVSAPDGSLIKADNDPTVYIVMGGGKSAIPSLSVLSRLGLNLNNLIVLSSQEMQNYQTAPPQM